ncbi:MAG: hypothetical protein ACLRXQ_04725 [Phascolarctobacterium faecium]
MEKMKLKIDYSVYLVTDTGFCRDVISLPALKPLKGGVTCCNIAIKMLTVVCCLNGRCC